jgi:putative sterol carrier protein
VELITEIEACRQLTYHTCWLFQNNIFAVKECSMVKMMATELGKKTADVCLQFFGGYGYMEEYPIARMYRDARVGTIVGGTTEIMKEILAKIVIDGISYESTYNAMKEQGQEAPAPAEKTETITDNNQNKSTASMSAQPETARDIIKSLPERFKADKAEGLDSTFHFDISGPNGGQFTVTIKDKTCTVQDGFQGTPSCLVTTSDQVYEDTELGRTNPQMAVMMGKIKISNLGEMMKFVGLFKRLTA